MKHLSMSQYKNVKDIKQIWEEIPHIAPKVTELLNKYLTKKMSVFEWGSGGSTIWISRRVKIIHSIEADEHWYNFLIEKIKEEKISNITIDYHPQTYLKLMLTEERKKEIEEDPDSYTNNIEKDNTKYDLIIVDGLVPFRNKCLGRALYFIKKEGRILFDDFQHPGFQSSKDLLLLNDWKIDFYPKPNRNLTGWIYK